MFGGFLYDVAKARAELLPSTMETSSTGSPIPSVSTVLDAVTTGLVPARLTPLPPGSTCLAGHPDCASRATKVIPGILAALLVALLTAIFGVLGGGLIIRRRTFGQAVGLVSIIVAFSFVARTVSAQDIGTPNGGTFTAILTSYSTTTTTVTLTGPPSLTARRTEDGFYGLEAFSGSSASPPADWGFYGSSSVAATPTSTADEGFYGHSDASSFTAPRYWLLIGLVVSFFACWASGAILGVLPGIRIATSPSETGNVVASPTSASHLHRSTQKSGGRHVRWTDLEETVDTPSTTPSGEDESTSHNDLQPVAQPIAGPSRSATRLAILLALIILAGIALPTAFAEPTTASRLPSHRSSSSWTWALPLLLTCWLLLPTKVSAQVPNVVMPAKVTTTEAGGPVYTLTLCDVGQGNATEEKRWVPLTCGAVARSGASLKKLLMLALVAGIAVLPIVAALQPGPTSPPRSTTQITPNVSTADSVDLQPHDKVYQSLPPAIVTIYSTTYVKPPPDCTDLSNMQKCPNTPLTVPKNEAPSPPNWAAATVVLWLFAASVAGVMAFLR